MGSGTRNNLWKILIGLAIVCGLLVFAGGFFHRRALEQSVQDAQDTSSLYVRTKLTHDVAGMDVSQPLKDADASALAKDVDLPGDTGLRLFTPNGTPVFTDEVGAFPPDEGALATAKAGDVSRVIDGADLRVYAPITGKGGKVDAVAAVVWNYTAMRKEASGPLDDYRLPLVALGVVLLVAGVVLMLQATKGAAKPAVPAAAPKAAPSLTPAKGRITGFDFAPMPTEAEQQSAAAAELQAAVTGASATAMGATMVQPDEAPPRSRFRLGKKPADGNGDAPKEKRSLFGRRSEPEQETAAPAAAVAATAPGSELQREIAIRQALEDQLEQLRTQVKSQQEERVAATRQLGEQLEAAVRRAEDAEAQLGLAGGGGAAGAAEAAAAAAHIAALEKELAHARTAVSEAQARANQLLEAAKAAPPAPTPDPAAEQRVAEMAAQLTDAQQRATSAEQRASAAEQRAASVESVRDELEVKVAQLGARATELEQRAAELESSLQDANAGGDAVRAEIATLTAALAGANARAQELETVASAPTSSPEHEAEISRLRGELAKQMERAQAAEERIASLEADVLAAQRGVRSLSSHADPEPASSAPASDAVPPAPSGTDRYDEVWSAPSAPVERNGGGSVDATPAPADDDAVPAAVSATPGEAPSPDDDEAPPAEDDMWSLRARLAEAARKKHGLE